MAKLKKILDDQFKEAESLNLESTSPDKGKKVLKDIISGNLEQGTPDVQYVGSTGIGESKLDYDIPLTAVDNLQRIRAERQTGFEQAGSAIGRTAIGIPLGIVSNIAAIADIEDYYNQDNEVGNAITNTLEELKQNINENYLPIYRTSNEALDIGDSGWWFENGAGLTTSIGEFAATGYGVGATLNWINQLAKLGKYGSAASVLLNATALNQAEGIRSAIDVYKSTLESTGDEQTAADAASYTINLNRANILLNLTSASYFIKSPKFTRELIKNPSKLYATKTAATEGLQEFVEEEVNLVAEKAGLAKGEGRKYGFNEAVDDLLTKEGFEAGLLGALGGIGQTLATRGINNLRGNKAEELNRFTAQQAKIQDFEERIKTKNFPTFSKLFRTAKDMEGAHKELAQLQSKEELTPEDRDRIQDLKSSVLEKQALSNFELGTTDYLINFYETIANMPEEEALTKGYDIDVNSEFNYKKRAQEAIDTINELEDIYNSTRGRVNHTEVYQGLVNHKRISDKIDNLNLDIQKEKDELFKDKVNLGIEDDVDNTSQKAKLLPSYKFLKSLEKKKSKLEEELLENLEYVNKIQSPKYQEEYTPKNEVEKDIKDTRKSKIEDAKEAVKVADSSEELDEISKQNTVSDFDEEVDTEITNKQNTAQEVQPKVNPDAEDLLGEIYKRYAKVKGDTVFSAPNFKKEADSLIDKLEAAQPGTKLVFSDINSVTDLVQVLSKYVGFHPLVREFYSELNESLDKRKDATSGEQDTSTEQTSPDKIEHPKNYVNQNLKTAFSTLSYNKKEGKLIPIEGLDDHYLNNPDNLKPGAVIQYEVDLNDPWNQGEHATIENMKVFLTHYIDGNVNNKDASNRKIVGQLRAYKKDLPGAFWSNLSQLRKDIFKELEGKGPNVRIFSKPTKVSEKYLGEIKSIDINHAPHEVVAERQDPLIFGIGRRSADGLAELYVPNAPEGYDRAMPDFIRHNLTSGAVYQMLPASNGTIIPARVYTKALKDLPSAKETVKDLLSSATDENWKDIRKQVQDYVFVDFFVKNGELVSVIKRGDTKEYSKITDLDLFLDNKKVQVNANKINEQEEGYNQTISEAGWVETDVNPGQYTYASTIEIEPYKQNIDLTSLGFEMETAKPEDLKNEIVSETPSKPKRFKIKGAEPSIKIEIGERNDDFATRLIDGTSYKKWNSKEELNWFKDRFKNIDIEIETLEGLREIAKNGGVDAWGMFKDATVYINEAAATGTTYHEAFHAVFRLFLNDEQRNQILVEAQSETGLQDDLQLEEYLADRFMNYVQSDATDDTGIKAKIKSFFKRIYQLFKNVFSNNINIDELFYRTNAGFYKNKKPFQRNIDKFRGTIANRIAGLENPRILNRRIEMLNGLFFNIVDSYKQQDEFKNLNDLQIISRLGIPKIYSEVYGALIDLDERLEDDSFTEKVDPILDSFVVDMDEEGNPSFGPLYFQAARNLANFGIKVKFGNKAVETFDDGTGDSIVMAEEGALEGWQVEYVETSGKDTLSFRVKKALRLLRSGTNDDMGMPTFIDFHTLYNYLERNLSDIYSATEMMEELELLSNYKPEIKIIIDELNTDDRLKTEFVVNFTKSHVKHLFVNQVKDDDKTTFNVFNSNRRGVRTMIIDSWKNNLNSPIDNKITDSEGNIKKEVAASLASRYAGLVSKVSKLSSISEKDVAPIASILKDFGIDVTAKDLASQYVDTKKVNARNNLLKVLGNKGFELIVNKMAKGINPYESEARILNFLAESIANVRTDLFQSSHKNVENKTVYSHLVPNYMSKFISTLKSNPNKLDTYLRTRFYEDSPWLNEMKRNSEVLSELDFVLLDGLKRQGESKGTKYTKMGKSQLETTNINMYFNNGGTYGYFKVPILSDAPALPYIKYKKRDTLDAVVDDLYSVVMQEYKRIQRVKEELETLPENRKIKNLHTKQKDGSIRGTQYVFLPIMNSFKGDLFMKNGKDTKDFLKSWLDEEFITEKSKLEEIGVIGKDVKGNPLTNIDSRIKEQDSFLKEYFYNTVLANTQIIQLLSGDLAFYKDTEDFQKRNKQIWSPGLQLNYEAIRPTYKTVYVNDEERPSEFLENIKTALEENGISESEISKIVKQYEDVNVTDAQAYITLDRYKEIMQGLGRWSTRYDVAYERLSKGEGLPADFGLVMQPIKPFYFGHRLEDNRIVPTQNKNSEYLLLPQLAKQSEKLQKMLDFMINNKVDSINFVSAVKVGEYGAVDFDNIEEGVRHELNNSDYRLQQETPEHHIDTDNIFGTQIRKLILSDISDDAIFNIGSSKFTKTELINLYQDIIVADVNNAYKEVAGRFNNIEELQTLLLEEVRDRNMGEMFEEALELIEDPETGEKKFKLPLYHPLQSQRIESLLNSIFKNKITRAKINGGTFVQVSGFGFDDKLKVNIKDGAIESLDVLMPWWSKKYFPKDEAGNLDISKVPTPLKEALGYRIPTEDKYSMAPLKVVGFTPQEAGGGIILPADITKISGSDFDIDKMFVMLPNFRKSEEGIEKIEYNYGARPATQSKEARDNAKLDIMRAIMTNKDTFSKFINPGGFDNIKALRDKISKLEKSPASSKLNPILPSTQRELFDRNIPGRALKGIFVNQNNNHAYLQHTNISFVPNIAFDGQYRNSLNSLEDVDGKLISRTLAELLAAVVDNAKDPVLAGLNINSFTNDVLFTIIRTGYPLETAAAFLTQPVIKTLSENYFNYGDNKVAYNKAKKELLNEYVNKLGYKPDTKVSEFSPSTRDMFKYVDKDNQTEADKEYLKFQYNILNAFDKYYDMAEALTDVVRSTTMDTTGAGPTIADNEARINTVERVKTSKLITNTESLFSNNSSIKMLNSFYELGVVSPNDILSKYFPWGTELFSGAKNIISNNLKDRNLNAGEINFINKEVLAFLATDYSFFNSSKRESIINNLPTKVAKLKKADSAFGNQPLIKRLTITPKDKTTPINRINFTNNGSLTNEERQLISDSWKYLLQNDKYSAIANELVLYTFFTSGFAFTPNSFSHLIPVDFLHNLRDDKNSFNKYLEKLEKNLIFEDMVANNFVEQFYRNNYTNSNYVPRIAEDNSNITGDIVMKNNSPLSVTVDIKNVSSTDFVLGTTEEGETRMAPFIAKNIKGKIYLFKLAALQDNVATYKVTNPLGLPNLVKEYDVTDTNLDTIIKKNKAKNADTKVNIEAKRPEPTMQKGTGITDLSEIMMSISDEQIEELKKNCNE